MLIATPCCEVFRHGAHRLQDFIECVGGHNLLLASNPLATLEHSAAAKNNLPCQLRQAFLIAALRPPASLLQLQRRAKPLVANHRGLCIILSLSPIARQTYSRARRAAQAAFA